jgi:hypothetical protein
MPRPNNTLCPGRDSKSYLLSYIANLYQITGRDDVVRRYGSQYGKDVGYTVPVRRIMNENIVDAK